MTQIFLGLFSLIICGIYAWGISLIPILAFGDPMGPRMLPIFLTILLFSIGCGLVIAGLCKREQWHDEWQHFLDWLCENELRRVLTFVCWIGVYVWLFEVLGYLLATAGFLSGLTLLAHKSQRLIGVSVALSFSVGSYYFFKGVIGLPLPPGPSPF